MKSAVFYHFIDDESNACICKRAGIGTYYICLVFILTIIDICVD